MYRGEMSNYLDTIQHNFDTTHIGITWGYYGEHHLWQAVQGAGRLVQDSLGIPQAKANHQPVQLQSLNSFNVNRSFILQLYKYM